MTKTNSAAAIAALFILSSCATGQWTHANFSEPRFRQDTLECEYDAEKATAGIRSGMQAGFEKGSLIRKCLEVRGYRYTFNR